MKKIQIVTIVIILITVLLVASWAYQQMKSHQQQKTISQISIMEKTQNSNLITATTTRFFDSEIPSDWKTYTNNQYGFELKYPLNTTVTDNPDGATVANWSVVSFRNTEKLDFTTWFNSYLYKISNRDCEFFGSNLSIGNYKSYLVSAVSMDDINCSDGGYYAVSDDNSKIVKFTFGHDPLPEGKLRQILLTFKFIK